MVKVQHNKLKYVLYSFCKKIGYVRIINVNVMAPCSEGYIFRRSYVQKVELCSEDPLFRRFYVQKVLCSDGPMFRNICAEGPMVRKSYIDYI